ncbi:hypothetical protein KKA66_00090, partial [Patescibacteria group bacterium]|nr:hypothetical protein [Patescibacteria group bacterium]
MYLYINTSNHEHIFLALVNNKADVLIQKNIKARYQQSERLLESIKNIIFCHFERSEKSLKSG